MTLLAYRAEMATAQEMSEADPFGGKGQRYELLVSREEAIAWAQERNLAFVIWPDCIWVAPREEATGRGGERTA